MYNENLKGFICYKYIINFLKIFIKYLEVEPIIIKL